MVFLKVKMIFLALCTMAWSQSNSPSPLMKCLAEEESRFHENKEKGPKVGLNKSLLHLLSRINDIYLKESYYRKVCKETSQDNRSVTLLKLLLTKSQDLFISKSEDPAYLGIQRNFLEDLGPSSIKIFLEYLARIQSQMPTAQCLQDEIPILNKVANRFLILEGDVKNDDLITKADIQNIFIRLRNLAQIKQMCELKKRRTRPAS